MIRRLPLAIAIVLSAADIAAAQNPPQGSAPRTFVAIGCLSREGPAQAQGGAAPTFIITDTRAKPPMRYRVDGTTEQLGWHVGHTLEIAGSVTQPASGRGGGNAAASLPTLKVQSIAYISPNCIKYQ